MENRQNHRLNEPVITPKKVSRKPIRKKRTPTKRAWDKFHAGIPLSPNEKNILKGKDWSKLTPSPPIYPTFTDDQKKEYADSVNERDRKLRETHPTKKRLRNRTRNNSQEIKAGDSRVCSSCGTRFGNSSFDESHHTHYDAKNKRLKKRRTYCFYCRQKMNAEYYQKHKKDLAERGEKINQRNRDIKSENNGYVKETWKNKEKINECTR